MEHKLFLSIQGIFLQDHAATCVGVFVEVKLPK